MNILDYLGTEFASFEEKPFNPVDSAALSQFCMVRAEGIVPPLRERKAFGRLGTIVKNLLSPSGRPAHFLDTLRAEHYEHMFSGLIPGRVKENMLALAASPRFRDMVIRDYLSLFDTERQTQFAAMTFVHRKDFAYVGFRGTDTSFTGWRENFNMAYTAPVPAQEQAARYLQAVTPRAPKRVYVGGHSKGANLALYAALNASAAVQDRIERVYTHDGPGFKAGAFSPDDWRKLDGRIHRTVPQDSVIGMLMESHTPPLVVHSTERGLLQHSPFSWEVDGDDFVYLDNLTENARFTDALLTEWLARYSDEEAAAIVDALFKAVEASGAQNATEVFFGGAKTVALLSEAAKNIANLVLLDSDFSHLPQIVNEGRRVINNIQRTASLFLVKTAFSVILSLLTLFFIPVYPFEPIQLTLISTVSIGIPSFFLALEPNHERVQGNFLVNVFRNALPGALCVVASVFYVYGLTAIEAMSQDTISTMCVLLAGGSSLAVLFHVCYPFNRNRAVIFAAMCAMFLLCVRVPFLTSWFMLKGLSVQQLIFVFIGIAAIPIVQRMLHTLCDWLLFRRLSKRN